MRYYTIKKGKRKPISKVQLLLRNAMGDWVLINRWNNTSYVVKIRSTPPPEWERREWEYVYAPGTLAPLL